MRRIFCFVASGGLLGLAVAVHAGCWFAYDDYYVPLTNPALADAGSDGNNADCSGNPTTDPAIVTDECGVFVSASAAPGGNGKQATPFQTFAEAAATKPARVFACAGAYTETTQVNVQRGRRGLRRVHRLHGDELDVVGEHAGGDHDGRGRAGRRARRGREQARERERDGAERTDDDAGRVVDRGAR